MWLPKLSFLVLIPISVWGLGLIWFVFTLPHSSPSLSSPESTDAIVVLTGGPERIQTGIHLLRQRFGKKLFISGVSKDYPPQVFFQKCKLQTDPIQQAINLGYEAKSTVDNAKETLIWMHKQGFSSLRLVTSYYHVRRSLLEFSNGFENIVVIPHPTFPSLADPKNKKVARKNAMIILLEYHKYLGALVRFYGRSLRNGLQTPFFK